MKQRVCKEDQIKLIMECRQSGLSDYQWCEKNGIHPGMSIPAYFEPPVRTLRATIPPNGSQYSGARKPPFRT